MAIDLQARGLATNVGASAINAENSPTNGDVLVYVGGEFEWQAPSSGTNYLGLWNANLNDPIIQSGVGTAGDFYIVSVAGNTLIDGINTWEVNDTIQFNGTVWQRVPALAVFNTPIELTGTQTITQLNTVYLVNATVADAVITIPDAELDNGGQSVQVLKLSGDFNVIVKTATNQNINLSPTQTIFQAGKGFTAVSRGSDLTWVITQDSRTSASVKTVNSNYEVEASDNVILCNGTFTVTLPVDLFTGYKVTVKNIGTGEVTISSVANIDDTTSKTIEFQYSSFDLIWNGTQWFVV